MGVCVGEGGGGGLCGRVLPAVVLPMCVCFTWNCPHLEFPERDLDDLLCLGRGLRAALHATGQENVGVGWVVCGAGGGGVGGGGIATCMYEPTANCQLPPVTWGGGLLQHVHAPPGGNACLCSLRPAWEHTGARMRMCACMPCVWSGQPAPLHSRTCTADALSAHSPPPPSPAPRTSSPAPGRPPQCHSTWRSTGTRPSA